MRGVATFIVTTIAFVVPAFAADRLAEGKRKATTCVACHGAERGSMNPLWPNLAGQHTAYLVKQLEDFRSGRRVDPVMSPIAKSVPAEDLAIIAAYFAALR